MYYTGGPFCNDCALDMRCSYAVAFRADVKSVGPAFGLVFCSSSV